GARLIHISSVAVYAGSAGYPATPERRDEDFPFQAIAAPDFYARSKRMAEDVVREAATHRDLEVAALRPTVIYGERDRLFTARGLARAAVSLASGETPYTDERIGAELGWRPPTQAREAIRRTVAWFLENEKPGH